MMSFKSMHGALLATSIAFTGPSAGAQQTQPAPAQAAQISAPTQLDLIRRFGAISKDLAALKCAQAATELDGVMNVIDKAKVNFRATPLSPEVAEVRQQEAQASEGIQVCVANSAANLMTPKVPPAAHQPRPVRQNRPGTAP